MAEVSDDETMELVDGLPLRVFPAAAWDEIPELEDLNLNDHLETRCGMEVPIFLWALHSGIGSKVAIPWSQPELGRIA